MSTVRHADNVLAGTALTLIGVTALLTVLAGSYTIAAVGCTCTVAVLRMLVK